MPFTTPPTAVDGTPVASAHVNVLRDNDNWFNGLLSSPVQAGQVPIATGATGATYALIGASSLTSGCVGTAQLAEPSVSSTDIAPGAVDAAVLHSTVSTRLFSGGATPVGGWFRTAAAIAAGWTRETAADGRLLIGAGTTFSVTFTEETSYGTSWAHSHSVSGFVVAETPTGPDMNAWSQGPSASNPSLRRTLAHPGHTHLENTATVTSAWTIPSRAYVAARRS